jgi:purine catabolism regulator
MSVFVSELRQPGLFPDFKLIGGKSGLNNKIKTVTVFDAPDLSYWIKGGEFLVGNGYIFKDDPKGFLSFLEEMSKKGIAAVGMKFDRFLLFPNLEEIEKEADRLGLPVFQVPFGYSWTDILGAILKALEREERKIPETESLAPYFSDCKDVEDVIRRLSGDLNRNVFFKYRSDRNSLFHVPSREGGAFSPICASDYYAAKVIDINPFPTKSLLSMRSEKRAFQEQSSCFVYATENPPFFEIHVFMSKDEATLSLSEEKIVMRGISTIKIILTEQELTRKQRNEEINQVMERLLLGSYNDPQLVLRTFQRWNVRPPLPCRVAVFDVDGAEVILGGKSETARLFTKIGNLTACIKKANTLEEDRIFFDDFGIVGGIGSQANTFDEIKTSFSEAKTVYFFSKKDPLAKHPVFYEDMLFELSLNKFSTIEEATGLWKKYWKPLKERKKASYVSLERFASSYIDSNFNLTACSKSLNIHYNTARNYLTALENALGLSFVKTRDCHLLFLARQLDLFRSSH